MREFPDYAPDPQAGKVLLSKDMLEGEDETISPEEYTRRQNAEEGKARRMFVQKWEEEGGEALRSTCDRLWSRKEEAEAATAGLLRKRATAEAAAKRAQELAKQYAPIASSAETRFCEIGTYKDNTADGETIFWRRTESGLELLTPEENPVLSVPPSTSYQGLEGRARAEYRRLRQPWLKKRKLAGWYHLRAAVCENVLREIELYGEPVPSKTNTDSSPDDGILRVLTDSNKRLRWIDEELNPRRVSDEWTWEDCYDHLEELCEDLGIQCPYSSADSLARSYRNWQ